MAAGVTFACAIGNTEGFNSALCASAARVGIGVVPRADDALEVVRLPRASQLAGSAHRTVGQLQMLALDLIVNG